MLLNWAAYSFDDRWAYQQRYCGSRLTSGQKPSDASFGWRSNLVSSGRNSGIGWTMMRSRRARRLRFLAHGIRALG